MAMVAVENESIVWLESGAGCGGGWAGDGGDVMTMMIVNDGKDR